MVSQIDEQLSGLLPGLLRVRVTEALPESVTAELLVRPAVCTTGGILHGGTIMAFADTLGGVATALNLKPGQLTTTIESKTNFFAAARVEQVIQAACTPLHRGRRTMVWQTRIVLPDGRLVAQVIQTQIVIEAPRPATTDV
ncbi:MAG: PaaI family thioesterase [Chloroflexi bacterium]|nr:PaaI family thioesterase [Chloroflexota bacterium]